MRCNESQGAHNENTIISPVTIENQLTLSRPYQITTRHDPVSGFLWVCCSMLLAGVQIHTLINIISYGLSPARVAGAAVTALVLGAVILCTISFFSSAIVLRENHLTVLKREIWGVKREQTTTLGNIKRGTVDEARNFLDTGNAASDSALNNVLNRFRNTRAGSAPLMYLRLYQGESIVVFLRPFRKRELNLIIDAMKDHNVLVADSHLIVSKP
jgi:hypothetical protein